MMGDISGWTILVVDDEPDSLSVLSDALSLSGAAVLTASSGEAALALLRTATPSLIVLDLTMPHPNGWELLEMIRANPALRDVPVVAITAFYSDLVAERVHEAGFDAYFEKPIRTEPFVGMLRELLGT
jgi:two-component system cell cycle response regulator DivK